ncbi:hypothetical protein EN873_24400 [bacterium M00.F.Ca.ET.230.01.1.1]|nr:hypothetical protein EN873_24400 [bacterium M00.F.Ca.ET.230.01.1.1]
MRPREHGKFIATSQPEIAMEDGTRLRVAGPIGSIRGGQPVSFWVATDYTGHGREIAHSLKIAA